MPHPSTYWDTSAFAKLVLRDEEGADVAIATFDESEEVATSALTIPEAYSAVAKAVRMGALQEHEVAKAVDLLQERFDEFDSLGIDLPLLERAAQITLSQNVSAADAIHLASALRISPDNSFTFVTWDRRQAVAARALGFDVQPATELSV